MGCQEQRHDYNALFGVFEDNLFSFLEKSPKTVVKVDSIQVSVCGISDQLSEASEMMEQSDNCSHSSHPSPPQLTTSQVKDRVTCEMLESSTCRQDNELLQNSFQTNNSSSKRKSETANLLHPRAAKNGINTLNLPELIGRREKLV